MAETSEKVLRKALELSPGERAALVDELMSSLDQPDEHIDRRWAQEAEERLKAFRAGELKAIPAEDVLDQTEES